MYTSYNATERKERERERERERKKKRGIYKHLKDIIIE